MTKKEIYELKDFLTTKASLASFQENFENHCFYRRGMQKDDINLDEFLYWTPDAETAISCAFPWHGTKEGPEIWRALNDQWYDLKVRNVH